MKQSGTEEEQFTFDDACEVWALAQLLPFEGIEDGANRVYEFINKHLGKFAND
jgi:hypothetical protein